MKNITRIIGRNLANIKYYDGEIDEVTKFPLTEINMKLWHGSTARIFDNFKSSLKNQTNFKDNTKEKILNNIKNEN